MTEAFLIPLDGLLVRDPGNKTPLAATGETKPLIGKEGRYWRRRIKDGSVYIKETVTRIKKIKETKENK